MAIRPAYLPSLKTFWNLSQTDTALFADHLQYVKRSQITASAPLTENGQRLRIPVKHDPTPQAIARKRTDEQDNWRRKHWQTLRHVYHDHPFAYYYLPQIEEWYTTVQHNLADFLFTVSVTLSEFLHLDINWVRSSEMKMDASAHEDYLILMTRPDQTAKYLTEREDGLDWSALAQAGIRRGRFTPLPQTHLFQSYAEDSVLTFLMQFGPEAGYLIRQFMPANQESGKEV